MLHDDLVRIKNRHLIMCDCKHERADRELLFCDSCFCRLVLIQVDREEWLLTKFEYVMVKYFVDKAIMRNKEHIVVKC